MSKQLIFCLETNRSANTDWIYIQELLKRLYGVRTDVKYTPVYMGSKQKYRSPAIKKEINQKKRMFLGESYMLLCIDTDKINSDSVQKREFEDIKLYCRDNNYKIVWFNADIEDVFLGHKVDAKSKVKEAAKYQKNGLVSKLDVSVMERNIETQHGSNLVKVLKVILGEYMNQA